MAVSHCKHQWPVSSHLMQPMKSLVGRVTITVWDVDQVRSVLCKGVMPMPMERPRLQSRDTTAPWRKVSLTSEFVNILLQIWVDRMTHQGENQSQTPEPIWITLLLQIQNLDGKHLTLIARHKVLEVLSHQGSSESSCTECGGSGLVWDEQGSPGNQGGGHWPGRFEFQVCMV